MIRDAEVRRLARSTGVEPRTVELDYVLGWALRGIVDHPYLADRLVFKGGTCLRKCYFPNYRFSQDLDFTATRWFGWEELEEAVLGALGGAQDASGIDFSAGEPRLRVIDDEYGQESLRFTIYWRGPHTSGGSAPGLRLDITRNEVVAFDVADRRLLHPFSDADALGEVQLPCYALNEVMAEKVRAVLGQRIYAVSRDLYDIFSLMEHTEERAVLAGLPTKMDARGIDARGVDLGRMTERREEFQVDWERNLEGLLPPGAIRAFDEVWTPVVEFVGRMVEGLEGDSAAES